MFNYREFLKISVTQCVFQSYINSIGHLNDLHETLFDKISFRKTGLTKFKRCLLAELNRRVSLYPVNP